MSKKKKIIKILLIITCVIVLLISHFFIKLKVYEKVATKAINLYLDSKNIDKNEIKSLSINFDYKRGNGYDIFITYKDEPGLRYEYFYYTKSKKLEYSTTYYTDGSLISLDIDEYKGKIIPSHEDLDLVLDYDFENDRLLLKYTFTDYIKDLINNLINKISA